MQTQRDISPLHALMQVMRETLATETRAEFEERYLAEAVDHADLELRLHRLTERQQQRMSRPALHLAAPVR